MGRQPVSAVFGTHFGVCRRWGKTLGVTALVYRQFNRVHAIVWPERLGTFTPLAGYGTGGSRTFWGSLSAFGDEYDVWWRWPRAKTDAGHGRHGIVSGAGNRTPPWAAC